MINLSKSVRDVLVKLLLDWVPLDLVVGAFHYWSPSSGASAIRSLSLEGIAFLLQTGLASVGDLGPDGKQFRAWSGNHEEIIARVIELWPDGTSEPDTEVVYAIWLDATPTGTELANSFVEEYNQDYRASE